MNKATGSVSYSYLIASALEAYPDRVAFVQGGRKLTYRECSALISQYVQVFEAQGLRQGQGVALVSNNCPEAWLAYAATLMAGCRFTPLQSRSALEDWEFVCADGDVSLLLYQAPNFSEPASQIASNLSIPALALCGDGGSNDLTHLAARAQAGRMQPIHASGDIARLPYTGGTTGRPKGVILSNRVLVYSAWLSLTQWQWPQEIRFLACTPISHAAVPMVFATLFKGGTVYMHDGFDPERFVHDIELHQITATHLVPTALYGLLDHPKFNPQRVRSLESILYGAAPIAAARLEQALDAMGPVFVQVYGQTEAPSTISILRKEDHDLKREHLLASCGRPLIGVSVQIHDHNEDECAVSEVGEICVRGENVMDGYWKRDDQTAEVLRGGWLHTGDLAHRDEQGYLYIVGRSKDMIISGGLNVYPQEVEDVLARHPSIQSAAVIGIPDEKWGEAVKAIVVLRVGSQADERELIDWVRKSKGGAMAPKSIKFVEALPLTPLGKIDKKALQTPD